MWVHSSRKILLPLQAGLIWLCLASLAWAKVENPALETVVTVMALDEQGQPVSSALGVIVRQDGLVLTCAAICQSGQPILVKIHRGDILQSQNPVCLDLLQDLMVLKIEATGLKAAQLQASKRPSAEGKIYYPITENNKVSFQEATLAGALPFSPRLEILKLKSFGPGAQPGAPVFNWRGEVVGMMHRGEDPNIGSQGKPAAFSYCLSCDRTILQISQATLFSHKDKPETGSRLDLSGEIPISAAFASFWDGIAATLGQNWELAQQKFAKAIAPPVQLPEAYYGRGVSRYHLGNYQGAIDDLLEATRRLPGYALAYFWLGKTWQKRGDQDAADAAYRQAVDIAPDLHEAWFFLGEMAYKRGDQDKAKECLEKAASDLPQAALRAWYLGNIARKQQRLPESLAAFKQAIQVDPKFFPGYLEGGKLLLLDMGESREAIGWLSQAVSLKPQDAETRYFLSLAYHLSWNVAEAWKQYYELEKIQSDLAGQLAKVLERSQ